jgi:hypothetical protein
MINTEFTDVTEDAERDPEPNILSADMAGI